MSCSCYCSIHWSQVLSREWRCSWSSADRRCSNYIWVISNFNFQCWPGCILYQRFDGNAANSTVVRGWGTIHAYTSEVTLITDNPYLACKGRIWGVYCEDLKENWSRYLGENLSCYNVTALHLCLIAIASIHSQDLSQYKDHLMNISFHRMINNDYLSCKKENKYW